MMQFKEKKLPVDIQSPETMQTENYLYVDKTRHIYRMITDGKFYFLSRPRRFGKTLLVSTLKCLFLGRKELFKGLWIAEQGEWEWKAHPVIVFDFNGIPASIPEALPQNLSFRLQEIGAAYKLILKAKPENPKKGSTLGSSNLNSHHPISGEQISMRLAG